jgi:hypothetical protein
MIVVVGGTTIVLLKEGQTCIPGTCAKDMQVWGSLHGSIIDVANHNDK